METVEFTVARFEFERLFPDKHVQWHPDWCHYQPAPDSGLSDGTLTYCLRRDRELQIWCTAKGIKVPVGKVII